VTAREASEYLRRNGIESPEAEALQLIAFCEGISRAEARFASCTSEKLLNALDERISGTPLQYIIGEWDFMGFTFKVSPHCLIPRADTELLCSYLVENAPYRGRFADLCTGSGCIALSVLNNTGGTWALAADLSDGALSVARKNAERLGLSDRADMILADVLSEGFLSDLAAHGPWDAILCNPPYIPEQVYCTLAPEIFFEPKTAFVGGEEGMAFYRILIPALLPALKPGGFLAFEIGYDQEARMCALAEASGCEATILKDLSEHPRVAVLRPR